MPTEIIPQAKKVSDALTRMLITAKRKDEAISREKFDFEMLRLFGASSNTVNDVLLKYEKARMIDLDEEHIYPILSADNEEE